MFSMFLAVRAVQLSRRIRLRIESDNHRQPVHSLGVNRSADDLQCFAVGTHGDGLHPFSGKREYEIVAKLLSQMAGAVGR
jgi:hypothetical protein